MTPLVSVLMPAYNAAPYIAEAIQSVLDQSYPAIELIIVNDGSRDATGETARQFESSKVRVIDQPNAGASAARNRAFRESAGSFIQYLDADDLISKDKIRWQVEKLHDHPGHISACRWGRFTNDILDTRFVPEPFWKDCQPVEFLTECWTRHSMIQPGAWLVPRKIIEAAGPWDETLSLNDDGEFFARVVLASGGILFCNESELYYRSGVPGALSSRKSDAAWDSAFRSHELNRQHILLKADSPEIRRAISRAYEMFVYDSYPSVPGLRQKATEVIREMKGPYFEPPFGSKMRAVSRVIGWKNAKILRSWISSLVGKSAK